MLSISQLGAVYHSGRNVVKALGPVSFSVASGETLAILGPSGCGKSTLLNVLCGITAIDQGSVLLDGSQLDPKTKSIGYIPQHFGLLPWKTVAENCALPRHLHHQKSDSSWKAAATEIFRQLDITGLEKRYPSELSGGQKQRAAMARAFLMKPQLLLMDEPFSALDALLREDAQRLFLSLWHHHPTTTLLVTHSVPEAVTLGQKILILSGSPGQIVTVLDNPAFVAGEQQDGLLFQAVSQQIRLMIHNGWRLP